MVVTAALATLARASGSELDARFRDAPAGHAPDGEGRGIAIIGPGTRFARPLAAWAGTGWKGKTFDRGRGTLQNRITPFGLHAITAAVREDESWVDGRPCIVLDYASTSLVARFVRDEIREIGPDLYLGVVFGGRHRLPVRFALDFA